MTGSTIADKISITKLKVIAVEGKDDQFFFEGFIAHLGLQSIQVIPMQGKSPLTAKIMGVKSASGFNKVTSFGLVIDADDDYASASQSVRNALKHANLSVPPAPITTEGDQPKVTWMILPRENSAGMLEDLCFESVKSNPAASCVDKYFTCLSKLKIKPSNCAKAKVHAFLSSREEPDKRLGEAAKAGYWPFEDKTFEEVKRFLRKI